MPFPTVQAIASLFVDNTFQLLITSGLLRNILYSAPALKQGFKCGKFVVERLQFLLKRFEFLLFLKSKTLGAGRASGLRFRAGSLSFLRDSFRSRALGLLTGLPRPEFRICSGEILYSAIARQYKKMVNHIIQETTVVAHDNKATAKIGQILLKNAEGCYVEIVSGFVKHQEIRLRQEYRSKIETSTLPSAKFPDKFLLVGRRKRKY